MNPNDDVGRFSLDIVENTMYVGHLPYMDKLVSYLTSGNEDLDVLHFSNSGVVCLEKGIDNYHIIWYLQPEICEKQL